MSACSDSQSTILPFPSSPHWDPTTTTLAMRRLSFASPTPEIAQKQQRLARHSEPLSDKGSDRLRQAQGAATALPSSAQRPDFAGLIHPSRRATLTTADDSALSKAISRQDRGGCHMPTFRM